MAATNHHRHELVVYEPTDTSPEVTTLAGFLAGYSGRTREAYALDLRQFVRWCQDRSLGLFEVTRTHIEVYARQLEDDGRAPATIGRRLSTLAGFYRYATEEGVIEHSPAVHRKGGKTVTIPLAPRTARALDLTIGERVEGPISSAPMGTGCGGTPRRGWCAAWPSEPGSPRRSARTPCVTPSSRQRSMPACRCGTCRRPRRTPIRARPCGMTGPASPWTGTPPTSCPPSSPDPAAVTPAARQPDIADSTWDGAPRRRGAPQPQIGSSSPADEARQTSTRTGNIQRLEARRGPAMLTNYFIATTDLEAATAVELDGLGSFPSVDGRGVEPVVKMGRLHALLMGRSYEDVVARSSGELIAERDDGESLVLKLDGDLLHALATSSDLTWRRLRSHGPRQKSSGATATRRRSRRFWLSSLRWRGRQSSATELSTAT